MSVRSSAVVAVLVAGLGAAIGPSLVDRARSRTATATLDALGDALVAFHDAHGTWPDAALFTGGDLVDALLADGALTVRPRNPVTLAPYGTVDLEDDRLWYVVTRDGRRCTLELTDADGTSVVAARELDADQRR